MYPLFTFLCFRAKFANAFVFELEVENAIPPLDFRAAGCETWVETYDSNSRATRPRDVSSETFGSYTHRV